MRRRMQRAVACGVRRRRVVAARHGCQSVPQGPRRRNTVHEHVRVAVVTEVPLHREVTAVRHWHRGCGQRHGRRANDRGATAVVV